MDITVNSEEKLQDTTLTKQETSTEKQYAYAGFWLRFWAYIIDIVVLFSINGILLSPLKFLNEGYAISIGFWTVNTILAGIIYYIYFSVMTKVFQQTVGKMIIGIKVIKEDGGYLLWNDILFREVIGRFIHNVFLILKLLYIVVAFNEEKQGIHDMIGNTRVIHV